MTIEQIIQNATHSIMARQVAEVDKFVVNFFGSMEEAKKQAHNYVIEMDPPEWNEATINNNDFVFRVEQRYRIRLKTPEEKLAEYPTELDDQGKMCVLNGHHLTSVDEDGFCDYCGQQ